MTEVLPCRCFRLESLVITTTSRRERSLSFGVLKGAAGLPTMGAMTQAASVSTQPDSSAAIEEVCRHVKQALAAEPCELALLFVSSAHAAQFDTLARQVRAALGCAHLIGCTGEAIAGGATEIEDRPALSLWAANLPGAEIESFHVTFERTQDGLFCSGMPELPGDADAGRQTMFLLGDPLTCAVDAFISRLEDDAPGLPLIGGMASGGAGPGQNRLFWNDTSFAAGAVGALIRGGPRVHSIVSQGCHPIGKPFVVTRGEYNIVYELGGKPAMERLQELFGELSERERKLVKNGLHLGIVMNEYQERFQRGDFLIANVIGVDQETGAIGIGKAIRTGQTVQFHVRDAETADEELRHLLERTKAEVAAFEGSLLFSCNGRGTRLFPEPHHDAAAIQAACGPIPLAGFFAQGELGPVGGHNYIHGFTASVALFEAS